MPTTSFSIALSLDPLNVQTSGIADDGGRRKVYAKNARRAIGSRRRNATSDPNTMKMRKLEKNEIAQGKKFARKPGKNRIA
jgi:hypothetical protein